MNRSSRQKITLALNDMLDWVELTNMYKTFLPKQRDYTFSSAHGTFSRIDHMVGHKTSPNKFKKTEISSIFSTYSDMKLKISYTKLENSQICRD